MSIWPIQFFSCSEVWVSLLCFVLKLLWTRTQALVGHTSCGHFNCVQLPQIFQKNYEPGNPHTSWTNTSSWTASAPQRANPTNSENAFPLYQRAVKASGCSETSCSKHVKYPCAHVHKPLGALSKLCVWPSLSKSCEPVHKIWNCVPSSSKSCEAERNISETAVPLHEKLFTPEVEFEVCYW